MKYITVFWNNENEETQGIVEIHNSIEDANKDFNTWKDRWPNACVAQLIELKES